jgi:hypothetical protein
MSWHRPDFTEINMSAEIGGYQSDDRPGDVPSPLDNNQPAPARSCSKASTGVDVTSLSAARET